MLRWAGRSGSPRPRCSNASKLPDRWWDSSRAGRSFIPEQTYRSPAGPGPWRSRKSPSTSDRDVSAGADHATAKAAIAGISPAIEIVDVTEPPEDPERILSGNIYQRHVVLAGQAPAKTGSASDGIVCRVLRRGREFARTDDPQANTGNWVDIVRHVADVLAAFGERLRGGEIIITGSVVPPIAIEPGEDTIAFEVDPCGAVEVRFSDFKQPGE